MSNQFDERVSDAEQDIGPSDNFVDSVMKQVSPSRFSWTRPYALAVPVFALMLFVIPITREAILQQVYPERAVAVSVDNDLNSISDLLNDLDEFDDSQLDVFSR